MPSRKQRNIELTPPRKIQGPAIKDKENFIGAIEFIHHVTLFEEGTHHWTSISAKPKRQINITVPFAEIALYALLLEILGSYLIATTISILLCQIPAIIPTVLNFFNGFICEKEFFGLGIKVAVFQQSQHTLQQQNQVKSTIILPPIISSSNGTNSAPTGIVQRPTIPMEKSQTLVIIPSPLKFFNGFFCEQEFFGPITIPFAEIALYALLFSFSQLAIGNASPLPSCKQRSSSFSSPWLDESNNSSLFKLLYHRQLYLIATTISILLCQKPAIIPTPLNFFNGFICEKVFQQFQHTLQQQNRVKSTIFPPIISSSKWGCMVKMEAMLETIAHINSSSSTQL